MEDVGRVSVFHNPAMLQHQQFMAECTDNGQIVADKDIA